MKSLIYIVLILIQVSFVSCQSNDQDRINLGGERITLQSKTLGEEREIYIYQPSGVWGMDEEMENLPVVFVLDAESQFLITVSTIDFLSAAYNGNDFMPRSIVVGITNPTRNLDLTPIQDEESDFETGGGPEFLKFITSELIPYIDSNYSTCGHRTLIGHSLGGLFVFSALIEAHEFFNNYVSIDPALGFAKAAYYSKVLESFDTADLSEENLFVSVANTRPSFINAEDLLKDTSDFLTQIDVTNQKFLNLYESQEWEINMEMKYYPDDNHFSVPFQTTSDALRHFYKSYSFSEIIDYYHPAYAERKDLVARMKNHFKENSEMTGCEMIPTEGYLWSFANGLAQFGRTDLALDMLNYSISLYPERSSVYSNFGYYHMRNDNNEEAIRLFDKSLSLSHDAEILEERNRLLQNR